MKSLRRLVFVNALLLAAAGGTIAFNPPLSLPVRYAVGEPYQSLALVHVVAMALAGAALALLLQGLGSLVGEVRRLALGLSLANGLIAFMFLAEQVAFDGDWVGWVLMLIALAMAAALVWLARRPLRPGEVEAEIAALKIPDEIRQGLLRQIGEAAAQEERNRLARDLHDSIKQQLFSINVGTAAGQERWERDPEGARKALADVRRSAREAMVEMQAMLHQLRPEALGMAGLVEALREQCEALGYRTGAEVTLELGEPLPDERLPPGTAEALFRMAQEMLANVARHARARQVRLWLGRRDEAAILRVEDDGQGFEPKAERSGMGLQNLKERAAALRSAVEVASAPGAGTRVQVRVPLIPLVAGQPVDMTRLGLPQVVYAVVVLTGGFLAAHYSMAAHYSHHRVASWPFAILIVLMLIAGWPLDRRFKRMEPHVQEYLRQQGTILFIPMTLWPISFGAGRDLSLQGWSIGELLVLGAVGVSLFLIGARGWIAFQRASEARRFWRKGSRAWLALVLLTEAGIALVAGSFLLAPERLVLNPLEILPLLAMGIAVVYIASRQMRQEGAPS